MQNTFQAILIADDVRSVALFIYDSITWSASGQNHAVVGINDGAGNSQIDLNSGSKYIAVIDTTVGNTGEQGQQVFFTVKSGTASNSTSPYAACTEWHQQDIDRFGQTPTIVAAANPCPCSLEQAERDVRWVLANSTGKQNCYLPRLNSMLNPVKVRC